jgi:hypothetical protein
MTSNTFFRVWAGAQVVYKNSLTFGTEITNNYCGEAYNGIALINGTPGLSAQEPFNFADNEFENLNFGLVLSGNFDDPNTPNVRPTIAGNTITTALTITPSPFPDIPESAGIWSIYNPGLVIRDNTITGFAAPVGPRPIFGVLVENSPQTQVLCNTINRHTAGVRFSDLCEQSTVRNNFLLDNQAGLIITNNGIIGQQGFDASGADAANFNVWGRTDAAFNPPYAAADMFALVSAGSDGTQSPFLAPTDDTPLAPLAGLGTFTFNPLNLQNGWFNPSTLAIDFDCVNAPLSSDCIDVFPDAQFSYQPPTGCVDHFFFTSGGGYSINDLGLVVRVATDSLVFPKFTTQSRYRMKQDLFDVLTRDVPLRNAHPALAQFYTTSLGTNLYRLWQLDSTLASGNLVHAAQLNAALQPQNMLEANERAFNTLAIALAEADSLTPTQLNELVALAQRCPLSDGRAVYRARVLRARFHGPWVGYPDVCTDYATLMRTTDRTTTQPDNTLRFRLHPNPTQGRVTVSRIGGAGEVHLEITNLTGNPVLTTTLPADAPAQELKLDGLAAGVYLCRFVQNGQTLETQKLVLTR